MYEKSPAKAAGPNKDLCNCVLVFQMLSHHAVRVEQYNVQPLALCILDGAFGSSGATAKYGNHVRRCVHHVPVALLHTALYIVVIEHDAVIRRLEKAVVPGDIPFIPALLLPDVGNAGDEPDVGVLRFQILHDFPAPDVRSPGHAAIEILHSGLYLRLYICSEPCLEPPAHIVIFIHAIWQLLRPVSCKAQAFCPFLHTAAPHFPRYCCSLSSSNY